jgi:hypothetical protein
MGWVVTSLRTEALEALVTGEAREAARGIVAAAEREARRLGRVAARETADAGAYLDALAELGEQTRRQVAEERRRLRETRPPEGDGEIRVTAATAEPHPAPPRPRPAARASLRESPLAELFRVTG